MSLLPENDYHSIREGKPGIYYDLTDADYYSIRDGNWPALNQTLANVMLKQSPEHAHSIFTGWSEKKRTRSMDIGTIVHKLLLGRGKQIVRIDADDYKKTATQLTRDAAYESGAIPVLEHKYAEAIECADAVREKLAQRGILLTGHSESALVWRSEGVLCKGMLDHVELGDNSADVYDIKSIVSADAETCRKHCINYGYDVQRSAYIEGLETVMPAMAGRIRYKWIFLETEAPFSVAVRGARGSMRERGERRWRWAVHTWRNCITSGNWTGYADDDIDCKPWDMEEL